MAEDEEPKSRAFVWPDPPIGQRFFTEEVFNKHSQLSPPLLEFLQKIPGVRLRCSLPPGYQSQLPKITLKAKAARDLQGLETLKSGFNYPHYSQMTEGLMKYFHFLKNKYSVKGARVETKKEAEQHQQWALFQKQVSKEQEEFQMFVKEVAMASAEDFAKLLPGAEEYLMKCLEANKERVLSYPQLYCMNQTVNLKTDPVLPSDPQLTLLQPPKYQNNVKLLGWQEVRNNNKNHQYLTDVNNSPTSPEAHKETSSLSSEECPSDIDIVISIEALATLVDNHQLENYPHQWEIPFTVKTSQTATGQFQKTVIMEDPFMAHSYHPNTANKLLATELFKGYLTNQGAQSMVSRKRSGAHDQTLVFRKRHCVIRSPQGQERETVPAAPQGGRDDPFGSTEDDITVLETLGSGSSFFSGGDGTRWTKEMSSSYKSTQSFPTADANTAPGTSRSVLPGKHPRKRTLPSQFDAVMFVKSGMSLQDEKGLLDNLERDSGKTKGSEECASLGINQESKGNVSQDVESDNVILPSKMPLEYTKPDQESVGTSLSKGHDPLDVDREATGAVQHDLMNTGGVHSSNDNEDVNQKSTGTLLSEECGTLAVHQEKAQEEAGNKTTLPLKDNTDSTAATGDSRMNTSRDIHGAAESQCSQQASHGGDEEDSLEIASGNGPSELESPKLSLAVDLSDSRTTSGKESGRKLDQSSQNAARLSEDVSLSEDEMGLVMDIGMSDDAVIPPLAIVGTAGITEEEAKREKLNSGVESQKVTRGTAESQEQTKGKGDDSTPISPSGMRSEAVNSRSVEQRRTRSAAKKARVEANVGRRTRSASRDDDQSDLEQTRSGTRVKNVGASKRQQGKAASAKEIIGNLSPSTEQGSNMTGTRQTRSGKVISSEIIPPKKGKSNSNQDDRRNADTGSDACERKNVHVGSFPLSDEELVNAKQTESVKSLNDLFLGALRSGANKDGTVTNQMTKKEGMGGDHPVLAQAKNMDMESVIPNRSDKVSVTSEGETSSAPERKTRSGKTISFPSKGEFEEVVGQKEMEKIKKEPPSQDEPPIVVRRATRRRSARSSKITGTKTTQGGNLTSNEDRRLGMTSGDGQSETADLSCDHSRSEVNPGIVSGDNSNARKLRSTRKRSSNDGGNEDCKSPATMTRLKMSLDGAVDSDSSDDDSDTSPVQSKEEGLKKGSKAAQSLGGSIGESSQSEQELLIDLGDGSLGSSGSKDPGKMKMSPPKKTKQRVQHISGNTSSSAKSEPSGIRPQSTPSMPLLDNIMKLQKKLIASKKEGKKESVEPTPAPPEKVPQSSGSFFDDILQHQRKLFKMRTEEAETESNQRNTDKEAGGGKTDSRKMTAGERADTGFWKIGKLRICLRGGIDGVYWDSKAKRVVAATANAKLEQQPWFGFEQVSMGEISRLWLKAALFPESSLIRGRIHCHSSELMKVELLNMNTIGAWTQFQPAYAVKVLHNIFNKLLTLSDGSYLLMHHAGNPQAFVYSTVEEATAHRFVIYDLHGEHQKATLHRTPPTEIPWAPLDPNLQLPRSDIWRIPCTFPAPPYVKANEYYNSRLFNPQEGLREPKKKNKKKKKKKNPSENQNQKTAKNSEKTAKTS